MKSLFLLLLLMATIDASAQSENEEPVFTEVEQMPLFEADCEDADDEKACADLAMLNFIYNEIRYPGEAREAEAEGMAVISFIVETDGTISGVTIFRDPGYGMGAEVLRIVQSMNFRGITWKPGLEDGKAVRVEFKLPVKFSLS